MRNWNIIRSGIKRELAISKPTWNRWLKIAVEKGVEAVGEHRHGNNLKLESKQRSEICCLKRNSPWKSARNIRDGLCLPVVSKTVENVLKKEGLWHLNVERLKPLQRFVAFSNSKELSLGVKPRGKFIKLFRQQNSLGNN